MLNSLQKRTFASSHCSLMNLFTKNMSHGYFWLQSGRKIEKRPEFSSVCSFLKLRIILLNCFILLVITWPPPFFFAPFFCS